MRVKVLVLIIFVPTFLSLQSAAQTVDELIQRNIESRGGLQKIRAVKSMKMSGTILVQGTRGKFTLLNSRPSRSCDNSFWSSAARKTSLTLS